MFGSKGAWKAEAVVLPKKDIRKVSKKSKKKKKKLKIKTNQKRKGKKTR